MTPAAVAQRRRHLRWSRADLRRWLADDSPPPTLVLASPWHEPSHRPASRAVVVALVTAAPTLIAASIGPLGVLLWLAWRLP